MVITFFQHFATSLVTIFQSYLVEDTGLTSHSMPLSRRTRPEDVDLQCLESPSCIVAIATQTQTASPSVDESKSDSYYSDLPPEIWLRVFEFLTHIPGVFAISDGRAIEAYSEDSQGIILHGLYHDSMRVKLMISLVSRMWRSLAMPLLFEYVMIRTGPHARIVANSLARYRLQQGEDEYYGRWIKRVELVLHDHYWEQENVDAIACILKHAPNVLVFSDFFSTGRLRSCATRTVIDTLKLLCQHGRLRRIETSGAIAFRIHRLLSGTPYLEVLLTKHMTLHPVTLPCLHTLVIGGSGAIFNYELETMRTPNLRNLITHNNVFDPLSCSAPTHPGILYPSLKHKRYLCLDNKLSLFNVRDSPGLTSITLDFGRMPILEDLENFRIRHQTLERIDLVRLPIFSHHARTSFGAGERTFVFAFLESLLNKEACPSLRTIGFLRPLSYFDTGDFTRHMTTRERIQDAGFWVTFIAQCEARGVSLEASVGANDHFCGVWQSFHVGLLPLRLDI